MFYLIGLGLSSPKDITLAGLEAIRRSQRVYLEAYTSILMEASTDQLEALYGKREDGTNIKLQLADREMVETQSDEILKNAAVDHVSFLVVGDPFGATTHTDLLLRCKESKIPYKAIHNASVLNAIGATGLSLYNYGQTVSIPFFIGNWKPRSWVDRLLDNLSLGLHTLLLLDIKVKEQSEENLARGRKIYEPPRFMSIPTAINQLLTSLKPPCPEDSADAAPMTEHAPLPVTRLDPDKTLAISVSRLGSSTQKFCAGSLSQLAQLDAKGFGDPLHSLIIIGHRLNPIERDYISQFAVDTDQWYCLAREQYKCS
ncbi:hypothetical protein CROQUDRAFT_94719 [Cronartium quercuum f. sp. fusiforme G11]|uniref:diphthine methyl ester synthase n=1 Tax=Cronartium quercuum f. sp. fusiforme G11 TaxID=708437 RepID=A0A9P6NDF6_9BASI|nr:hypothetical protein CROQUDRAFT_94719 [Cronartium quercuum f. sp. fusiforme G11]